MTRPNPKASQWNFDKACYNALPQLDKANAAFQSRKEHFDEFVKDASHFLSGTLFNDGQIGAFLLHRHWRLPANAIMVERPRVLVNGEKALVTAATASRIALASGVKPGRWAASSKGAVTALEYSSDPFVTEMHSLLDKNRGVARELSVIVHKHRLELILGYMIIPRMSVEVPPGYDLVETNRDKISIVKPERLTPSESAIAIKTGWALGDSRLGTLGNVWKCCYCIHHPGGSCKHPLPNPDPPPPICKPTGCVWPAPPNSDQPDV